MSLNHTPHIYCRVLQSFRDRNFSLHKNLIEDALLGAALQVLAPQQDEDGERLFLMPPNVRLGFTRALSSGGPDSEDYRDVDIILSTQVVPGEVPDFEEIGDEFVSAFLAAIAPHLDQENGALRIRFRWECFELHEFQRIYSSGP